jgi:hypothetical protein
MRDWMIPWLFPLGLLVLVLLVAFTPVWVPGIVAAATVFGVLPMTVRTYTRTHPDRRLPDWLPGGRSPR